MVLFTKPQLTIHHNKTTLQDTSDDYHVDKFGGTLELVRGEIITINNIFNKLLYKKKVR